MFVNQQLMVKQLEQNVSFTYLFINHSILLFVNLQDALVFVISIYPARHPLAVFLFHSFRSIQYISFPLIFATTCYSVLLVGIPSLFVPAVASPVSLVTPHAPLLFPRLSVPCQHLFCHPKGLLFIYNLPFSDIFIFACYLCTRTPQSGNLPITHIFASFLRRLSFVTECIRQGNRSGMKKRQGFYWE